MLINLTSLSKAFKNTWGKWLWVKLFLGQELHDSYF